MTSFLFLKEEIYCCIFRCNYLTQRKYFLKSFLHLLNLHSILNILKKQMAFIADVFLNLRTPENVFREVSKNSRFRGPFEKYHGKWAEILLKSERLHF